MLFDDVVPKLAPVEIPRVRKKDRVSARGIASIPLHLVSDTDAQELLKQHNGLIWLMLNRFRPYLQRLGGVKAGVEETDLHLIGQVALLCAWVKWDPARGAWSTVARPTSATRSVALGLECRSASLFAQQIRAVGSYFLPDRSSWGRARRSPISSRSLHPDAEDVALEHAQQRSWLRRQLDGAGRLGRDGQPLLTARQKQIVEVMMTSETFNDAAERIGDISRQGVQVQYEAALVKLRDAADMDGFEIP
jgi:hypothetical protein